MCLFSSYPLVKNEMMDVVCLLHCCVRGGMTILWNNKDFCLRNNNSTLSAKDYDCVSSYYQRKNILFIWQLKKKMIKKHAFTGCGIFRDMVLLTKITSHEAVQVNTPFMHSTHHAVVLLASKQLFMKLEKC